MHEFLGGVEGEVASDTDAFAAVFFCPFLVALFIYLSIHSFYISRIVVAIIIDDDATNRFVNVGV